VQIALHCGRHLLSECRHRAKRDDDRSFGRIVADLAKGAQGTPECLRESERQVPVLKVHPHPESHAINQYLAFPLSAATTRTMTGPTT